MKRCAAIVITFILCTTLFLCPISASYQSAPRDKNISADITHTDTAPVLDGVISEGEYTSLNIPRTSLSYVTGSESDWAKAHTLVFSAYACNDGEYLYFAVTYIQDSASRKAECDVRNMWAQSCLLVSLAPRDAVGRSALECGYRLSKDNTQSCYVWNNYNNTSYRPDGDFTVAYENNILTYEIRVPFSAFNAVGDDEIAFVFSISTGDYYNNGRYIYVQFGQGISGFSSQTDADAGKNAAIFPTAYIKSGNTADTDAETQAQTDAPVPSAPETSDNGVTVILILLSIPVLTVFIRPLIKRKR